MLDELLGRAPLQAQIDELTEEIDRLEAQLAGESKRRKEAVRNRQSAEERANELEDRIAGLEGELKSKTTERDGPAFFRTETRTHHAITEIIATLQSIHTPEESAFTASISDNVPPEITDLLDDRAELLHSIMPCLLCIDDHRLTRVALIPPRLPDPFSTWDDHFTLDEDWFLPTDGAKFALVRSDRFAVGTISAGSIQYENGFTSDVMNTHSKGGFSQARFDRRRDEQIANHIDRVEDALSTGSSEPLFLAGDRHIIKRLSIAATGTKTVDASGKPQAALTNAFDAFWQTRVFLF